MTEIRGTSTGNSRADSLTEWLSARTDAELTELLRLRPDLAVPPPSTMVVLGGRAQQRASVSRAADELDTLDFGILELMALAGAEETPMSRKELNDALAERALTGKGKVTKKAVDASLAKMRATALIWGTDPISMVPAVIDSIPWRVGRALEPVESMSEAEITAALNALEKRERDLLETLANSSPIGRTRDAAPETPADRPVQKLLAAGLLRWLDEQTVELPATVRQAIRGEPVFDPTTLTAPVITGDKLKPADVNAAAAGEALELVRQSEKVVAVLGAAPAPALRAGGLGVRELRRIAKAAELDESRVNLLVELLSAAGLIASGTPDPTPSVDTSDDYWTPTVAVDGWLNATTARRWEVLASAWIDVPRVPWMIGMRDPSDKPIAALAEEGRAPSAPRDRASVLGLLAELDSGQSASPAEVSRLLAWRHPRRSGRLRTLAVENTLAEASALGLVARGALSSPGRAMLHGGDAEAEMAAVLPKPIDYFLVQADLTLVAPGPLVPDLLEQVTLVADIESAGSASMYRITEGSIRRALDAGLTATELQTMFSTKSKTPVPQSLSYLIDDVARRHGRLRAGVAASFIRCEDASLLAEVLASAVAETLALRALAPTVAVSQAPLREVLAELRAAGFAPAGEDSSGALVDLRPRGARIQNRRLRQTPRTQSSPSPEQLESLIRTLRAGDRASSPGRGGVRADGSRESSAAAIALLSSAARAGKSVNIGYVDAQGVATHRIVDPVSVGGGQLDAFDPASGAVRRFTLHRITSVTPIDEKKS
ncbi:helicase-associated domain-containing protein [Rhodococcus sp. OK302]|uniref:helicase-associated domain-containing protein n=1 Tax=Rhodococcus sp. OK302 TaxID=1882769 RepID=UPI000B93E7BF|nr:helicase-associated domain-containing protein [Rhodococcus sp. OK302]OYD68373.1 XPB/Ssl2-like helicase family protein [Rhodococcus sp. OK302]